MEEKSSTKQLSSAFNLFKTSKDIVLANFNVFALVYLLPLLFALANVLVSNKLKNTAQADIENQLSKPNASLMGGVFGGILLSVILFVIVSIITYVLLYKSAKGEKPTVKELIPDFKKFGWRLVGLSLLTFLYIAVGLMLLIVPGIIMIRRYFLAPYFLLDKDLSVGVAMKQSAAASKPFSGAIWGVIGVTFLLSMAGVIPVIGWLISFVLGMLYAVAPGLRYFEIKRAAK